MARINPRLVARLKAELNVGKAQLYKLIAKKVSQTRLPRPLAAIALAADAGVNISRYASEAELSALRQSSGPPPPGVAAPIYIQPITTRRKGKREPRATANGQRGNSIFVVHGRNEALRRALFSFLRAISLNPIEWQKAIKLTGDANPYIGDILETAFRKAVAIVVLMAPEDEARLMHKFLRAGDPASEKALMGQPRPNVLFEAGMAIGKNPDNTVLVQVGNIRPFTDIAGRHVVRLSNTVEARRELITKLRNAGCNVDDSGIDWIAEGDFEGPLRVPQADP